MADISEATSETSLIVKGFKRVRTSCWWLIFAFLLTLIADTIYLIFTFIHGVDWAFDAEPLGIAQYWFLLEVITGIGTLLQLIGLILFANGQKKYSEYTETGKGSIKASRIIATFYLIILVLINIMRFIILGFHFEMTGDLRGIVAPIVLSLYILLFSLAMFFSNSALKKMKEEKGIPSKSMVTPYLLFIPLLGQILALVFSFIASMDGIYAYTYLISIILFNFLVIVTCINFLMILKKEEIQTIT
ncbi:MAG: hypothetical protein GF308_06010 [Candidatus Heimdallarchaeota archaeon]|nr:hypothetical protein [Candidatus Heimdallarchaeota archaeon]